MITTARVTPSLMFVLSLPEDIVAGIHLWPQPCLSGGDEVAVELPGHCEVGRLRHRGSAGRDGVARRGRPDSSRDPDAAVADGFEALRPQKVDGRGRRGTQASRKEDAVRVPLQPVPKGVQAARVEPDGVRDVWPHRRQPGRRINE
jgi:hypothetical protein